MSSPKSKQLRCLDMLQQLKEGRLDPALLTPSERRPLVALLMAEGQSTAEIAHFLQTSDRTIERDKKALRQDSALAQDPELAGIMAGRLSDEGQLCIQRIRRIQREGNCPPAAKIEGERACFQIMNELTARLQSMGYLPTVSQRVEADLVHYKGDSLSLVDIQSETQRLLDIGESLPKRKIKRVKSKTLKRVRKNND